MKKILSVLTVLAVVSMLFACSGGGGGGGDDDQVSSSAPVAVSFSVISNDGNVMTKSISSNDGVNSGSFRYYYRAVPVWNGAQRGSVIGSTGENYVEFTTQYKTGSAVATKFAQGSWTFYIDVRASDGRTVLYDNGNGTPFSVSAGKENTVEVSVERKNNGSSSVAVHVAVPTVENGSLTVTYAPIATPNSTTSFAVDYTTDAKAVEDQEGAAAGWTRYDGTETLDAGSYIFYFKYSRVVNQQVTEIASVPVAINVISGASPTLEGTLEDGDFQAVTFAISGITIFGIKFSDNPAPASTVAINGSVVFSAVKLTNESVAAATYNWYVGGDLVETNGTGSFTFTPADHYNKTGYTSVTCVAVSSEENGYLVSSATQAMTVTD